MPHQDIAWRLRGFILSIAVLSPLSPQTAPQLQNVAAINGSFSSL